MAQEIGVAYVTVAPSAKGFGKSVEGEIDKGVGGATEKAGGRLKELAGNALKWGGIAIAGIGAAITGLALKGGISRALNIEDAQAKLKGLGHDTASVDQIMTDALASVKGTAFGLDAAATVAASAVAAGIKPGQDLERYLRLTADAATIAGGSMGDLGRVMNDVTTLGAAYNDSLQILAQKGMPIYQWLADELGTTTDEVKKLASEGKISSETFRTAIENNISGAALAAGDTTRGAFANAGAALSRLGASAATGFLPYIKDALGEFITLTDGITERMAPLVKSFSDWFDRTLGPLIDGFGDRALAAFDKFAKGWGSLSDGFDPGKLITTLSDALHSGLTKLADWIANGGATQIGEGFLASRSTLVDAILKIIPALIRALATLIPDALDVVRQLVGGIANALPGIVQALVDMTPTLIQAAITLIQSLSEALTQALPLILGAILLALPALIDGITEFAPRILTLVVETVTTLLPSLIKTITSIVPALIKEVVGALADILPQLVATVAEMAPALLQAAIDAFMALVRAILEVAPDLITTLLGLLPDLIKTLLGMVPQLLDSAATLFMAIVGAVLDIAPSLIETLLGLLPSLIETLLGMVPQLLDSAVTLFLSLIQALADVLPDLLTTLLTVVLPQLLTTILTMIPDILTAAITAFTALVEGLTAILPDLIETLIGEVLPSLIQTLIDLVPVLVQAAIQVFMALVDALITITPELLSAAISVIAALISGLLKLAPQLLTLGADLFEKVGEGLRDAWPAIWEWLKSLPSKFIEATKNARQWLLDAGKRIIDGLLSGITDGFKRVKDKLSDLTHLLPSWKGPAEVDARLLTEPGRKIMQSLVAGFDAEAPAVQSYLASFTAGIPSAAEAGATQAADAASGSVDIESIVARTTGRALREAMAEIRRLSQQLARQGVTA